MGKNRRRLILLSILMAVVWVTLLAVHVQLTFRLVSLNKGWGTDVRFGFLTVSLMLLILLCCFITIIIIVRRERQIVEFREKMVHSIIHELKTPITSINLACQLLQDPTVPKDAESTSTYIAMIDNESQTLRDLVEEVLSVFRTNQIPKKELREVSLHKLLHSVVDVHRLALEECGAKVYYDLLAENDKVLGDATHLGNAFSNLIDNAIKYRNGDLILNLSTRNVKNMIEVRVADNGIGIDKKDQKLVFEPFSRVNTDNANYVKGFGLGLSYVGFVVDYHQGSVKIESELGEGATFIVSLPILN